MKKNLTFIRIIITIVFAVLLYYFQLPAFNLKDPSLYSYILTVAICYLITCFFIFIYYIMVIIWKKLFFFN